MAKIDKRKEALLLLSRNISQVRVSEMIQVDRRTISRWMKDAGFREELSNTRRDHLEVVLDKVITDSPVAAEKVEELSQIDSLVGKAIAALQTILECPEARNADRLKASELVLRLVGSDRIQAFSGANSNGQVSKISVAEGLDRDVEIERLLQRRELLKSRISVLKK
jgi:transcriptional regulator with XRE-family HTH domain